MIGGRASVDRLAEQLLPRRPAGDERPEDRILAYYLGIDDDAPPWPTAGEVAAAVGTARSAVADALEAARDRWHKNRRSERRPRRDRRRCSRPLVASRRWMSLPAQLARRPADRSRMMSGSDPPRAGDDPGGGRTGSRGHRRSASPRYADAEGRPPLVAASAGGSGICTSPWPAARTLSPRRTRCRAPAVSRRSLASCRSRTAPVPLAAERRLRLAVAASKRAALSARGELYPRGMPPLTGASPLARRARRRRCPAARRTSAPASAAASRRPRRFRRDRSSMPCWRRRAPTASGASRPAERRATIARTISDTGTGTSTLDPPRHLRSGAGGHARSPRRPGHRGQDRLRGRARHLPRPHRRAAPRA